MQEIRFHGRGGQGTVVASFLLAKAFFKAGFYVQSFPLFGVERRGAPVEAYLRLDRQKVLVRSNVYTPDVVVVQDASLLSRVDIVRGLKSGGWLVLNSGQPPADAAGYAGFRLAWVDATGIALAHDLGTRTHPMVNTAMIGAFARILESPPLKLILEVIEQEISVKPVQNMQAARQAYDCVQRLGLALTGLPEETHHAADQ
jgi:2-oxoacid:acceptor oxidoreductase gamma subunit (pyruvate/2-ketoisovalerate family)